MGATQPQPPSPPAHDSLPPAPPPPTDNSDEAPTQAIALPPGRVVPPDPGLYAVLGLDPGASDAEIQTTYRRQAARLLSNGAEGSAALRQLNVAYEVLGNPFRRAEYDRLRTTQVGAFAPPTPIRSGPKNAVRTTRRRRPRHVVQPRYTGLGDVFVVITVVGLAVLAGVLLIPRLQINLSALNALSNVVPISTRRVIDTSATPAATPTVQPTAGPTPTVPPTLAAQFNGSTVKVSNPTPAQNASESVVINLKRDGQPAANVDVYSVLHYRTTDERWPIAGTVRTDAAGNATISFNVGDATLGYPVQVQVFAQVDDQQLAWSTSFTPR